MRVGAAPVDEVAHIDPATVAEPLAARPLDDPVEALPVPPADGPKLAPIVSAVPVLARPERGAPRIGYLRVGARVARSEKPVSLRGCEHGWYAVRPVGFVCAGEGVTTSLEHPVARALAEEPDRARPLPYRYAFTRDVVPNYLKVPSSEQQFELEPKLAWHLHAYRQRREEWDAFGLGANDVPLGPDGLATGPAPTSAPPSNALRRFGGDGSDAVPWWLDGDRRIANVSTLPAAPEDVMVDRAQRNAGVALIDSFVVGKDAQERRFAITPDARLLPADKLRSEPGSLFHGASLRGVGLPAAFVRRSGAHYYRVEQGALVRGEAVGFRAFVALTGNLRSVDGERMVETRDGRWLRSRDLKMALAPSRLPELAEGARRWIDVSIKHQLLVLWEGAEPVYATLVSTGKDGLGDPSSSHSTPRGVFTIQQKHVTHTMDSDVADDEFELRDVPWVMYFKGGYALHAAYWHDDFGRARSHGCVNLSPIDARYVFEWSLPDVPPHWHGAYASDSFGEGTLVRIEE